MKIINKYRLKVLAIVCFTLITISVFIAYNNPAIGYEASIFRSTPFIVWVFIFISFFSGVVLIVHQVYTREYESNNFWIFGVLIVFLSYATVLSLHIIRGYYMWNMTGDSATHLGIIKQIITNGNALQTNMYPILHIYVAELSQILGISLIQLHTLIPVYFNLLYLVFMYFFAKSILHNKSMSIMVYVASSALLPQYMLILAPNHQANALLPLALFIIAKYINTKKMQWKILGSLIILFYPPFHILPAFILEIILVSLWIPKRVFSLITKDKMNKDDSIESIDKFNVDFSLFLIIWGIFWISSFRVWTMTMQRLRGLLLLGGPTHFSLLMGMMRFAGNNHYNIIEYVLKMLGGTLVYMIITIASIPFLWKELHTNKENISLIALYGPLSIISSCIMMFYFLNLIFGPLRLIVYINLMCSIFTGFIIFKIIEKTRSINKKYISNLILGFIVIFIVVIFAVGVQIIYPSSYILSTSWHTTKTEVDGMGWFVHNMDSRIGITGISIAPGRFADFLLTPEAKKNQIIPWYLSDEMKVSPHFGYNDHSSLSELYDKDVYLIIPRKNKSIYVDVVPEMAKDGWYPSDFDKLENDKGLDKLYMNGEFDVWYVNKNTLG